jgi:hypothetical protein
MITLVLKLVKSLSTQQPKCFHAPEMGIIPSYRLLKSQIYLQAVMKTTTDSYRES